jgi:hypothetical protein
MDGFQTCLYRDALVHLPLSRRQAHAGSRPRSEADSRASEGRHSRQLPAGASMERVIATLSSGGVSRSGTCRRYLFIPAHPWPATTRPYRLPASLRRQPSRELQPSLFLPAGRGERRRQVLDFRTEWIEGDAPADRWRHPRRGRVCAHWRQVRRWPECRLGPRQRLGSQVHLRPHHLVVVCLLFHVLCKIQEFRFRAKRYAATEYDRHEMTRWGLGV